MNNLRDSEDLRDNLHFYAEAATSIANLFIRAIGDLQAIEPAALSPFMFERPRQISCPHTSFPFQLLEQQTQKMHYEIMRIDNHDRERTRLLLLRHYFIFLHRLDSLF